MNDLAVITPEPWIPTTDTFGARLALVRQKQGWNAKEASLACGLSQNNWGNWESGIRCQDIEEASRKISARTGVDLYWLLTGRTVPGGGSRLLGTQPARRSWKLPRLDSNQEPIGFEAEGHRDADVASLAEYRERRKAS